MADRIILKGMTFYGYHGATPHEKERGQPFVVDIEMELDLSRPGRSDDLRDTVDYSAVYGVVREVVEGEGRNLLESVADGLAQRLLRDFPLDTVTVRVAKPHVPIHGAMLESAAVEVHRRRE
ncbi:MAG: dihydroneopterin aldolase [Chloroflexota bacterium]|nr:dihydroneopterin aldolase [Chloroflexota bacterium]MDE2941614.1 dihydroneopterin aldolase [Chloroflexota bacterium]MDE3267233.1 dihydroneopterin aldolase [Chloroflexota bacterium]